MIIDTIRSYAPGFIFTTALPPGHAAAACDPVDPPPEGLQFAEREAQQRAVATRTKEKPCGAAGLPVMPSETHIVPVLVGNADQVCKAGERSSSPRDHGIYIQPINYPTVPRGTERLRITPTPFHDDALVDHLIEALTETWQTLGLPLDGPTTREQVDHRAEIFAASGG